MVSTKGDTETTKDDNKPDMRKASEKVFPFRGNSWWEIPKAMKCIGPRNRKQASVARIRELREGGITRCWNIRQKPGQSKPCRPC